MSTIELEVTEGDIDIDLVFLERALGDSIPCEVWRLPMLACGLPAVARVRVRCVHREHSVWICKSCIVKLHAGTLTWSFGGECRCLVKDTGVRMLRGCHESDTGLLHGDGICDAEAYSGGWDGVRKPEPLHGLRLTVQRAMEPADRGRRGLPMR